MIENKLSKGFSLVELAIVITIIGLVTAVVATGLRVRETSELRSFITDVQNFQVANDSFMLKYEELPGDMSDAHSYWDNGSDTVCGTAAQCNGNGNGLLDFGGTQNDNEQFRAWQHLLLSGLVEGGYTGTGGGTGDQATPDINVPRTSRTATAYHMATFPSSLGDVPVNNPEGTFLVLGGFVTNNWPRDAALTPQEAKSIDKKIDDAIPDSGRVYGRYYWATTWQSSTCLTGTHPNRTYDLSRDDRECIMFFPVLP